VELNEGGYSMGLFCFLVILVGCSLSFGYYVVALLDVPVSEECPKCRKKKKAGRRRNMNKRLTHDVAWNVSQRILEVFSPLLREEEQHEAFTEILARVKAGIECYELQSKRMPGRRCPGKN